MSLGVAFLTGQSLPGSCELSPLQHQFAQQLIRKGVHLEPLNFPYREDMQPYRPSSLLSASFANICQYFCSRSRRFSDRYQQQLRLLFDKHPHTLILAGSCGLELLNNLDLPAEYQQRVHVLAYGPVARHRSGFPCTLVQGRRDWLSWYFFPQTDFIIDCGHMNYLYSPEFLAVVKQQIDHLLADNHD